ncbi:MAG: lysozyme inhibitor LprI family protein [Terracidiphilus sp.]|jgi:uncharacterized protein YecT (DUF1311 family)
MRTHFVAIISSAIVSFALSGHGQQNQPARQEAFTPEQQKYQQWEAHYRQLQAQGKQIFDVEMAREKAGDCPNANTTADFDNCYGKHLNTSETNLKRFEATVHDLLALAPKMPGEEPTKPASGLEGPSVIAAQDTAEFESVEQLWRQYRELACSATHHQFDGGSGGPSFEMQCRLMLARDHMRELKMIYGESFL